MKHCFLTFTTLLLLLFLFTSPIHAYFFRAEQIGIGARSFWTEENQLAKSKIPRYISIIGSTKAGYVRVFVPWSYVQPLGMENTPPINWRWEKIDLMISSIKNNDMEPVVVLYNPPVWATTTKNLPKPELWHIFVTEIVNRYSYNIGNKQVKYWEILNEPDASIEFTAVEYGQFLKFTYPIIKTLDPQAKILNAGLTQHSINPEKGDWLNIFITHNNAEFGNYFDIFNLHAYGDLGGGSVLRAKSILAKWPITRNKPFWMTEVNLGSNIYKPVTPCSMVEDPIYLAKIKTMFTNFLVNGANKVFLHSAECTSWTGPSIFIRESEGSDTPSLIIRQNALDILRGDISSFINTNPADLEPDGDVDIFDFNTLVSNYGKTGAVGWIRADIIKNGKVDLFDYNSLVTNFGK